MPTKIAQIFQLGVAGFFFHFQNLVLIVSPVTSLEINSATASVHTGGPPKTEPPPKTSYTKGNS